MRRSMAGQEGHVTGLEIQLAHKYVLFSFLPGEEALMSIY